MTSALRGLIPNPARTAEAVHTATEHQPATPAVLTTLVRAVLDEAAVTPETGWLVDLYRDGYAAGASTAKPAAAAIAKDDQPDHHTLADVDWSGWSPGDPVTAANLIAGADEGDVLRLLLAHADVTIRSISENRLGQLARALADGIASGASTGDLTGTIRDLLDNPAQAETIARTETTRAMVAGQLDSYDALGVTWVEFLTAEDAQVDAPCEENEEHGPVPITETFPNGPPPVHPNCRCTLVPASGPNG